MPLPNILLCTLTILRILKRPRILTRTWAITFSREYFRGAYAQLTKPASIAELLDGARRGNTRGTGQRQRLRQSWPRILGSKSPHFSTLTQTKTPSDSSTCFCTTECRLAFSTANHTCRTMCPRPFTVARKTQNGTATPEDVHSVQREPGVPAGYMDRIRGVFASTVFPT